MNPWSHAVRGCQIRPLVGQEEAHTRALLLQAANAGLGLRRLTSENIEDSPQVTVSALLVSARRNDAALEQIIGRMSLEPFVTSPHLQAGQVAAEVRPILLVALSVWFGAGFRMPADRDLSNRTDGGFRKPPGKEPAGLGEQSAVYGDLPGQRLGWGLRWAG